jgi:hypothetical protein
VPRSISQKMTPKEEQAKATDPMGWGTARQADPDELARKIPSALLRSQKRKGDGRDAVSGRSQAARRGAQSRLIGLALCRIAWSHGGQRSDSIAVMVDAYSVPLSRRGRLRQGHRVGAVRQRDEARTRDKFLFEFAGRFASYAEGTVIDTVVIGWTGAVGLGS